MARGVREVVVSSGISQADADARYRQLTVNVPWVQISGIPTTLAGYGITLDAVTAPTLINSWVNFGGAYTGAGFWKDPTGVVWLRGEVKSGVAATVFVLPVGYRPAAQQEFPSMSNLGPAGGAVTIFANGNVNSYNTGLAALSFSGISFRTD